MQDNYLWDRSGEPDPEIQNLEEILGTLRYQPEPLKTPLHLPIGSRSRFVPAVAIAAALALVAVLVGFWFVRTRPQPSILQAKDEKQIDQKVIAPAPEPQAPSDTQPKVIATVKPAVKKHSQPNLIASHQRHLPRTEVRESALTAQELAEKEQVLVALRLVSFKLNLAQRKTQGGPQLNPIRNQHKIG
jgi:hypothetical protein